ncbi:MAG: tyrosine-type recombinase/integrase [Prevotella sp.]|nr:tyrosine-type recombinase/integrase [Prevotella sp.]
MPTNDNSNKTNPIVAFRRYLRLQRGLSPNTQEAYLRDVGKLVAWAYSAQEGEEESDHKKLLELELKDLQNFSASLHDMGIAASTHARILCGVRAFYKFMAMDGWVEQDPAELLESPIQDKHLPEVLSTAEVDMLEASIDLSKWEGHRNRAIIEVLFSCGLRVSELVNLTFAQVYEEEGFLRVFGKGSKERLVPISGKAIKELHLWYDDRCHLDIKPGEEDYVFLNRRGAHLTRTMILIMIKQQAAMAGIKKTISPTPCAIPLLLPFLRVAPLSVPFRLCWDMSASEQPRYTPTSTCPPSGRR